MYLCLLILLDSDHYSSVVFHGISSSRYGTVELDQMKVILVITTLIQKFQLKNVGPQKEMKGNQ